MKLWCEKEGTAKGADPRGKKIQYVLNKRPLELDSGAKDHRLARQLNRWGVCIIGSHGRKT